MSESTSETVLLEPLTFPPDVIARISPRISLQRQLSLSLRPSLKGFNDFRDIKVDNVNLSYFGISDKKYANDVLGYNIMKSGSTTVMTTIKGAIIDNQSVTKTEPNINALGNYSSIFPVVEIERGRGNAPPSDEEMTISQQLHDSVLHSRLLPKTSLKTKCGIRLKDEDGHYTISYPSDEAIESETVWNTNKECYYVLSAKILVFGRTGPLFELCWNSLIFALKSVKLPRIYTDDKSALMKIHIRSQGKSALVNESSKFFCDNQSYFKLSLEDSNISFASNYGIVQPDSNFALQDTTIINQNKNILLSDIDTETEETAIRSTISIINDSKGNVKNISIYGGGDKVTISDVKKALELSKIRSKHIYDKFNEL